MVATPSTMLPLGSPLPPSPCRGPTPRPGRPRTPSAPPALVVAFLCPHCPYVKHIEARFGEVAEDLMNRGAVVVAVQSNAIEDYPQDGPGAHGGPGGGQRLPLPLPARRLPGGGQGVQGRLHAGLLRLRRRAAPGLPRPVRRLPARQRPPGDRRRPRRRRRRAPRRRDASPRTRSPASAATSSGGPATSPTTSAEAPRRGRRRPGPSR